MNQPNDPIEGPPPVFHITVERDGSRWQIRIDDGRGSVAATETHALDDVETAVWDHMASYEDDHPGRVRIDIRLPPEIRQRLDRAEELRKEIEHELQDAVQHLTDAGYAPRDIDYLVGEYGRLTLGRQAAVITNAEIARHGLVEHPDAIAVAWDDHGHFATLTCRACVEANRREYAELPPEGENAVIYDPNGRYCDRCEKDLRSLPPV